MSTVTILDGGMGQELLRRSGAEPTPLWATQVMIAAPSLVRDIHADYFTAGAQIATTNTYALHRDRLEGTAFETDFEKLYRTALDMALEARDAHGGGQIAGSIGPLGQSYRADVQPEHDKAVDLFAEVARILARECDLLLLETVASIAQARAALEGVSGLGKPVWIAFTVDDEDGTKLRSGEALVDAVAASGKADALLANCSAPEAMPDALDILGSTGKPTGAYANAFTQITKDFLKRKPVVDVLTARRDLGPDAYADHAETWRAKGATIIGGCCETGPDHIAELARRFARDDG
ncbi:homocysteine S-methyltransferase family protein [Marivita sp. S6314]|uniref:homocysteine S-methyltransferase family protein n=1 Tax=Marivita sp. S6314 TaxID=2926406 RepID=UPI001FF48034|nr:homocysteine S-methyltransferase family protein [Marivita sp. S6314]MCK0151811.1 homocysteine S-methyltransferase family protein [Marivita sp. S6314]